MFVKHLRNSLVEEEHTGYALTTKFGQGSDYPYYLRSCAKPLQATLLVDYELDKIFDLTLEEVALCCASHSGEKCHTNIAENLLKKFGLKYDMLKCGLHPPLSKTRQREMFIEKEDYNYFHNNCVGKHLLFLALCKVNGWELESYDDVNHPLQVKVKEKINSLCGVTDDYPVTSDGCGVPIFSMPLKNILNGFVNVFCDEKYTMLKNAYLNCPYIIGGEDRLDTEIIQNSEHLVAKVGAGGLCVVVNVEEKDGLIVKINDCDMKTRRLVVLEALNKLGWVDYKFSKEILTLHNKLVGDIQINLEWE